LENHYQTLGVSFRATPEEIKSAYKQLALIYHPDKNQGSKTHEERFKAIAAAYQILSNPEKKNLYDLKLFYTTATSRVGDNMAGVYGTSASKIHKYAARDPYFRRFNRSQEKSSDSTRLKSGNSVQNFAIAMLIMASISMVALWLGNIMNHKTAQAHLERGDFVTALEFDSNYGEAYFEKAKHLKRMGLPATSVIRELSKAIKFAKKQSADMYLSRALEWMRIDNYSQAVDDLKVATKLNPRSYNTLVLLGDLQNYNLNLYAEAELSYKSAIEQGADVSLVSVGWGLAQLKQEKYVEALANFNRGIALDESRADLFYFRGLTYKELKDSAAACADWDRALNMGKEEALPLYIQYCKPH